MRIAKACGGRLQDLIGSPNAHIAFDATCEHALRLYDAVCCNSLSRPADEGHTGLSRSSTLGIGTRRSTRFRDVCDAVMTKELLVAALEQQGFQGLREEPSFEELWQEWGGTMLGPVSFHTILRQLKLRVLAAARASTDERDAIGIIDWSPRQVADHYHNDDPTFDIFLTNRKARLPMRWVHGSQLSKLSVLLLAVKYQLHPLPVEDVLTLEEQQMPVVRKYGGHFFVILPVLRLSSESQSEATRLHKSAPEGTWVPRRVVVESGSLAIFVAGPPWYDTVISIRGAWHARCSHARPTIVEDPEERYPRQAVKADSMDSVNMTKLPNGEALDAVAAELLMDFSTLRTGNAQWLLWRLLDVCVDGIAPILGAYRLQLQWFSDEIERKGASCGHFLPKRLLHCKLELNWLQQKVRPMERVVRHLMAENDMDPEVTRYLEDVEDHLTEFIEEAKRLVELSDTLKEALASLLNSRQQDVLYVLTAITTLMAPTQILTGLYGMNFLNAAGEPTIPLLGRLDEGRGWYLFWGLGGVLTLLVYVYITKVLRWTPA